MKENELEISFYNFMRAIDNQLRKFKKDKDEAFILKDFDMAQKVIEKEKLLNLMKDKIKDLKKEFNIIFNNETDKNKIQKKFENNNKNNFIKGKRTREEEFYIPILESLMELGGRAESKFVIAKVHEKIKEKLTDYDYITLPNSKKVRWENTARWARKHLIDLGYLNSNSPTGIWEITEKGIEFYNNQKKEL